MLINVSTLTVLSEPDPPKTAKHSFFDGVFTSHVDMYILMRPMKKRKL